MYIGTVNKFNKKDVKRIGVIYKDESTGYLLSDLDNINISNTMKLNGYGFYNYVYDVCDTYLFIIGNCIRTKETNPKKIDYLSKILKFEYLLQQNNKSIKTIKIPSRVLTITTENKWLHDGIAGVYSNSIDNVIQTSKIHLQGTQSRYKQYMKYLCDNPVLNIGVFKNGLALNMLFSDEVIVYKDTEINAYIIKYNQQPFDM